MTNSTTLAEKSAVSNGNESAGTTDKRISGPHTEYDRYGRSTGHTYWRCEDCGNESLRREELRDCFGCNHGVQY
jgi:hypothetical protein